MERMNESQLKNAGYKPFKVAGLTPEYLGHIRTSVFWGDEEALRTNYSYPRYAWVHREAPCDWCKGWNNYRISFKPVEKWQQVEVCNL